MIRYVMNEDISNILSMLEQVKEAFSGYQETEFLEALYKAIDCRTAFLEEKGGRYFLKNFTRSDLLFSLCGLNCGLCPMYLGRYCPGCGGGEGNQSCKIARCSLQHGKPEYCSQCQEFPCEKYEHIDEFDSFITHQNRKKDLEKQRKIGAETYRAEQEEKIRILAFLLENYNDGRKKNFFCVAVNLTRCAT